MARFTDSPYEYMMTQKPGAVRGRGAGPPRIMVKNKCEDCPYGRGRPCVGVCMKKILSSVREKKRGQNEADT